MFGLSNLGFVHTLISLVALIAGLWSLVKYRGLAPISLSGRLYLVTTLLTALTALFIFRRGVFGPPHAMAIVTLLAVAAIHFAQSAGKWSRHVAIVGFTATLLFHLIAGITETLTRLPLNAPALPGPEAPQFVYIYAFIFAVVVLLGLWQWRVKIR